MKREKNTTHLLHNDVKTALKDATATQLKASVEWYSKKIEQYEEVMKEGSDQEKYYRNMVDGWKHNLAYCKAALSSHIGKNK